jgi:hypothetical protein
MLFVSYFHVNNLSVANDEDPISITTVDLALNMETKSRLIIAARPTGSHLPGLNVCIDWYRFYARSRKLRIHTRLISRIGT